MSEVVIIGGGIAGLATGALLATQGHQVEILEQRDEVGGRAGTLERDGFRFELGPSWYLMPEIFDHYFELLGTSTSEQLDLKLLDPGYRVFSPPTGGQPREPLTIPLGQDRVEAVFEDREPGAGWALREYLASAQQATDLAIDYFLYNPFTRISPFFTSDVIKAVPQLPGLLLRSLEDHVAARFSDPVLQQVLGYPAVFLGTRPSDAPSMYHLMSAMDLRDGVRYPMGGFWQIVERLAALAREAGVQITTGARVEAITTVPSRGRRRSKAAGVTWRDANGIQHHRAAQVVVSAADLHHTETQLLRAPDRTYPEKWWRGKVSGPGAVLALLGVEGELPELTHHSLFFTRDWDANFRAIFDEQRIPNPASLYVCRPSATDPDVAPQGHENLFVLVPMPADPSLGGGPDGSGSAAVEQVADAAISQISSWANIPDLAERIVVRETVGPQDFVRQYNSWRGGMLGPAHLLSQSAMFRAQNESKRVQGLYYAGATTAPGVGVPMCLISAELVAKRMVGDYSPGPWPTGGVR